jgi:hypothetical protein
MTIYAFGCSVTHGTETVTAEASEENIIHSYPARIAVKLGLECENYAIPGNSNEYIFHNFMEVIPKATDIDFVIIGWTSPIREVWYAHGRHWMLLPCWCSTTEDITKPPMYAIKTEPSCNELDPQIICDKQDYLDELKQLHKLLTLYKWDEAEYLKNRQHYITAVRFYCQANNIKLIETTWYHDICGVDINLTSVSPWFNEFRHPNIQEHDEFARLIIDHYKL